MTYRSRDTGDDQIFVRDEVFDVELTLIRNQLRAAIVPELLLDLLEFAGDDASNLRGIGQDRLQLGDRALQLRVLVTHLVLFEGRESPQGHVEYVLRLDLGEPEAYDQAAARFFNVGRGPDQLDDLLDVVESDDEAFEHVRAFLGFPQAVRACGGPSPRSGE